MTDPLYPRHANSGPAPEVTPPERPPTYNDWWVEFDRAANRDRYGFVSESDWVRFQMRKLGIIR